MRPLRSRSRQPELTASERFEALWTAHYADVFSYVFRRLRDQAAASDTASETFLVAWRRFDDTPEPSLAWLLGIARRVLANHHRGEKRRRALTVKVARSRRDPSPMLDVEPSGAVAQAFNALSATDREALSLVAWEELKPCEAAAVLGISPATFSVRLHRARSRFRDKLRLTNRPGLSRRPDDPGSSTPATPDRSEVAAR